MLTGSSETREGKQSQYARIRAEKRSQNAGSSLQTLDLTSPAAYFRAPRVDQRPVTNPCEAARGSARHVIGSGADDSGEEPDANDASGTRSETGFGPRRKPEAPLANVASD
jgi:hypothetical protein